jgi:hypothetical protein
MVIGGRTGNTQDLIFDNYIFQAVIDFKYLGTNINNSNKLRIAASNKYSDL